mmetsp:Transcript_28889/g.39861  ORF Transcript_28889/g.39861 Transcript_28889/m.39861 type:complete len:303 (+) Transcript_28889:293-1201(+)
MFLIEDHTSLSHPSSSSSSSLSSSSGSERKKKAMMRASKRKRPQVTIRCRDGSCYTCDYVLCAVPLGVLQSKHKDSSIFFDPPLPPKKQNAIESLGSGAHNKILVRFRPDDVFWPEDTPQIVPLDQRFHILNLHAYGKKGCLCAHVWPPFADGWDGKTDEEVVRELCEVLKGMFWRRKKKKTTSSSSSSENDDGSGGQDDPDAEAFRKEPFPTPLDYVVARWDSDPFALGSYSYLKLGATWPQIEDLARPYPAKDPHIFFAGEATSLEGIQCVTGAYKSGLRAAKQILADIANRRRGFIHTK